VAQLRNHVVELGLFAVDAWGELCLGLHDLHSWSLDPERFLRHVCITLLVLQTLCPFYFRSLHFLNFRFLMPFLRVLCNCSLLLYNFEPTSGLLSWMKEYVMFATLVFLFLSRVTNL
jgi:hypothetical protein